MHALYQQQKYSKNYSKKNISSSWHPSAKLLMNENDVAFGLKQDDYDVNFQ